MWESPTRVKMDFREVCCEDNELLLIISEQSPIVGSPGVNNEPTME
jgi:hypothetical protein